MPDEFKSGSWLAQLVVMCCRLLHVDAQPVARYRLHTYEAGYLLQWHHVTRLHTHQVPLHRGPVHRFRCATFWTVCS